jgi:hypothetical protein
MRLNLRPNSLSEAARMISRLREEISAMSECNPEPISLARLVGMMPRHKGARLCPYIAVTSSIAPTTLSWPRWSPARTTEWRSIERMHCLGVPIPTEAVAILPRKCGLVLAACIERQPLHCIDARPTSKQIGG